MDFDLASREKGMRIQRTAEASRSSSFLGRKRPAILAASIAGFLALCLTQGARGQTTWIGGTSGDWNTAANWTPATIPNGSSVASFGASSTMAVSVSQNFTQIGGLTFTASATSPYTITMKPLAALYFFGAGVTNSSGVTQNFETGTDSSKNSGGIFFSNRASAGSQTQYTNDAATVNGGFGGSLTFTSASTAGSAAIINQGSAVSGGLGGTTTFNANASAGGATITTNGGSNGGGGGATYFMDSADGGTAQAITNGNGIFDISQLTDGGMKIGSIEGSGKYYLGSNSLTVGGNNLSTTVSGVIADGGIGGGTGGSLIKTGTGTLTLTGTNTYIGGTTVNSGILQLGTAGAIGRLSATGTIGVNNGGSLQIVNVGTQIYGNTIANNMSNGVGGVGTVNINSANLNILTGVLSDGAVGQLALTQSGPGETIVANPNNTYSGPTTITAGTLRIGGTPTGGNYPGSIGASSAVSVSTGGVFELANVQNNLLANNVTNGAGGTGTINVTNNATVTLSGTLTDGPAGQLALSVPFGKAILTNVNNTYSGTTTVSNSSQLQIGTATSAGSVGASSVIDVGNSGTLVLTNVSGNKLVNNITNLSGTNSSGEVLINSTGTTTLSGVLSDGVAGLYLRQNGTGTTIMTGANTYTGLTEVDQGRLVVNGSLASTQVQVFGYPAILSGTGTISGAVTLFGGILAPGDISTPGTLTMGSLSAAGADGDNVFRLGQPTGTNDRVDVTGNLTFAGPLTIVPRAGFGVGTYTLFNYGGTLTASGDLTYDLTHTLGYAMSVSTAVSGKVQLVVSYAGGGQFWDGSGAANNGSITGGSGNWSAGGANWTNSTGTTNTTWNSGTAVFGGTAGTVTVSSAISAQALIFNSSGYTIAGSQTLTLSGSEPGINVANPGTIATITAPLKSYGTLDVGGPGTLILANAADNLFYTTVTAGTLQIGTASAAGSLGSGSDIILEQGGTLSLVNVAANFADYVYAGNGGGTLNVNSTNTITLSVRLSEYGLYGSLNVTQTGPGTTILTAQNYYTGTTTVSKGTLQIGTVTAAGSIGQDNTVNVGTGGALSLVNNGSNLFTTDVTNGLGGTGTLIINSPSTITVSGNLSDGVGKLAFTQSGSGTTILTGAQSYTGATNVNQGTLEVDGSLASGSTVNVSGSGTLTGSGTINGNATLAGNGIINFGSTGNIVGTLGATGGRWNGVGSVGGAVTVTGTASNVFTINGTLGAPAGLNVTGGAIAGSGTLNGDLNYTSNSNSTFGGVIAGTSSLTMNSATSTLTLTGDNTYTGATQVNGGTLQIGNGTSGSLGATSVTVSNSGTFATNLATDSTFTLDVYLNNATSALNAVQSGTNTLAGVISGAGIFNQKGTGTTILNGVETYAGVTNITAGTLQIGDGTVGNLAGTSGVTVSGSGDLAIDLADGDTFAPNINLSAAGAQIKAIQSGTNTLSGVISGSGVFNQNGLGTTILVSQETYTGATKVNAGILEVDGSLAAASVVNVGTNGTLTGTGTINGKATLTGNGTINLGSSGIIGGTLAVTGGNWNGSGKVNGLVTSSSGAFNINGNLTAPAGLSVTGGTLGGTGTLTGNLNYTSSSTSTFGGGVAGPGVAITMNKAGGTLILAGDNTYTGATNVLAGTLQIGNGTTGGLAGTSGITVSGTGVLATDFADATVFSSNIVLSATGASVKAIQSGTNTLSGVISGKGSFVENSTGTTILTNAETYTGATNVTAGTLQINGSLAAASVVNVGTGGTLAGTGTINGKATITGNGVINLGSGGRIVGTLTATGGNWNGLGSVSGAVTSTSGAFNINGDLTAPAGFTVSGGTLGGTGTLTGILNYKSSANSTFGGTVAGSGATITVNKAGGTLTLTGNNAYVGATSVMAGTLQIGNGTTGNLTGTSNVVVAGSGVLATDLATGATFDRNVNLSSAGATLKAIQAGTNTISGNIIGKGVFNQSGTGTTILTGAETYTGATKITTGTLEVDGSIAAGSVVGIATGGTLTGTGTIHGKATLTGNGIADFDGDILGTLTVTGGNWNGDGTVGGLVTLSSGVFNLNGDLNASSGLSVKGGSLAGTGTLAGNLIYASSTSSTFGGILAGNTVTMNKASTTLTLTGTNTYAGGTTITAGTLMLGNDTASGASLGTGRVTVNNNATLGLKILDHETFANDVTDNGHIIDSAASGIHTFSGTISGKGNFTKSGGSLVALTKPNTFTGGTIVNGGVLLANNTSGSATGTGAVTINSGGILGGSGMITGALTLNAGGIIAPGAGSLGIAGTTLQATSLMWKTGGTLELQLGPTGDELVMTGALTKSSTGTYILDLVDAGITQSTYTLLTFASTNFTAADFSIQWPVGYTGTLHETATSLSVDLTAVPLHAQSLLSGATLTMDDFPAGTELPAADPLSPDASDSITSSEGNLPASEMFNAPTTDNPAVTFVPTPEPGSAILLAAGSLMLIGRRRRSR